MWSTVSDGNMWHMIFTGSWIRAIMSWKKMWHYLCKNKLLLQTLHIAQELNARQLTWTSTLSSVWTCTVTVNMKSQQTQDLGHISPLSRPLSSSFLPLPLCKAQGIQSSKATPLCTSAVLDSQAGRRGEGPIRGPVGQGTWLWKDLGGLSIG